MASISQSFEDSGDVGDLQPGWSINLAATPHIIGEAAGGTGSVNSQVSARDDSLFVINDNVSTSYSSGFYDGNRIDGVVKSVSQTGNNVSISHSTQLDKYDADYNIPALTAGGIEPALDIASHLIGQSGILETYYHKLPGWGTSLCGHSNSFDADSNRVFGESKQTSYVYYNPSTGKYETINVEYLRNAVWADNYTHGDPFYIYPHVYADGLIGDSFSPIYEEANVEHLAYTFMLKEQLDEFGDPTGNFVTHSWGFDGNPMDNDFDYGFGCSIVIAPDSSVTVGFDVTEGGSPVEYKTTYYGTFLPNSWYTIYIKFSYGPDIAGSNRTRFYIQGAINNNNINFSQSVTLFTKPTWYSAWGTNGLVRDVWRYSEFVDMPNPAIVDTKYNYIVNNDFESNTAGWAVGAGAGATGYTLLRTANTLNFPHGLWSATTVAAATAGYDWYTVSNNVKNFNKPGPGGYATNVFSFYAKNYSSAVPSYIDIGFYDQLGTLITSQGFFLADEWDRYSHSILIDDTITEINIVIDVFSFAAGIFGMVFDAVQLEDNVLTDFWNASYNTNGPALRSFITANGQTYSREQYVEFPAIGEYINIPYIDYYSTQTGGIYGPLKPAVPGVKMNLWEYVQSAMAAYGYELTIGYGDTYTTQISSSLTEISNYSQVPSVTPTSSFSGRSVDIVYTNASVASGTEVYDAYDDGNKIITVKSKETVTVTINSNSYLNTINQPKRKFSLPNADGYFIVSDSTGVPVGGTNTNTAWEDYGGKVSVAINPDIPGAIDVTVTGPFQEIPAYPGPYKLAYSDGSNDYAALSILGNGVKVDNKTLNLQTGAVRAKTKQEVAKTVTNPFIGTLEQAYDAGLWVSADAAGPKVSFSAAASNIDFTKPPTGTIIHYGDSSYRVMDSSTSVISTSVNAQRYAISSTSDSVWSTKTVAYHDGIWARNKVQDKIIAPYKYIDIVNNSVKISNGYISFDVDGKPYFKFAVDGEGEAQLLFDTDGTPYYVYLTGSNSATLLELDTDFTPYHV